jgi:hypothetical protein
VYVCMHILCMCVCIYEILRHICIVDVYVRANQGPTKITGKDYLFYILTVTENGCGMKHKEINL